MNQLGRRIDQLCPLPRTTSSARTVHPSGPTWSASRSESRTTWAAGGAPSSRAPTSSGASARMGRRTARAWTPWGARRRRGGLGAPGRLGRGGRPGEQGADELRGVGADGQDDVERVDAVGGPGPAGGVVPGERSGSHAGDGDRGRTAAAAEHLHARSGGEQPDQRDAGLPADPGQQDAAYDSSSVFGRRTSTLRPLGYGRPRGAVAASGDVYNQSCSRA